MTQTEVPAPPTPPPPIVPERTHPPGDTRPRVNPLVLFVLGGIGVMIVIGIASALIAALGPGSTKGDCLDANTCVTPVAIPFSNGTPSIANDLGYSYRYDAGNLTQSTKSSDGRDVTLKTDGGHWIVRVTGAPASDSTPQSLLDDRMDDLTSEYGELEQDPGSGSDAEHSDNSPTHLVSQSIGHIRAIGGSYRSVGFSDGPTGDTAFIAIFAAGNGRVNIVISVAVITDYYTYNEDATDTAESRCNGWKWVKCGRNTGTLILDTMQWP